jgi:hypothetical protein
MHHLVNTFSDRSRLKEILAAVYTDIGQFFVLAVDFFARKGWPPVYLGLGLY